MTSVYCPLIHLLLLGFGAATSISASASGGRDQHFGDGGKVFVGERAPIPGKPSYAYETLLDVAMDKVGRTVAVGYVNDLPDQIALQALVNVRRPSGAPDESFNGNGYLFLSWLGQGLMLRSVSIQPDGNILVAGNTSAASSAPIVCRVLYSGGLDMSFSVSGCRTLDIVHGSAAISWLNGIELLDDGSILAMGSPASPFEAARNAVVLKLRTDGTDDTAFGATDTCATPAPRCAIAVLPQAVATGFEATALAGDPETGEYVIAGSVLSEKPEQQTALQAFRFNSGGDIKWIGEALDFSFLSGNSAYQHAFDAEISVAHDKTVLAGMVSGVDSTLAVIGQLDAGGVLDAQFGNPESPGRVALSVGESSGNAITDIDIQDDGRIVAAATSAFPLSPRCHVLRFNANGTRDVGFGNDGVVSMPWREGETNCSTESITANGRNIVIAGGKDMASRARWTTPISSVSIRTTC